jgi:hypothetical protein
VTSSGTIEHADTSTQTDITATTDTYVDGLTFDTYGHVTGVTTSAAFDGAYGSLTGVPTTFAPSAHTHAVNDLTDVTITAAATGEVLRYDGSAWVDAQLAYSDLSGTPSLATVATSGAYSDLTGAPTIPSTIEDLTNVTVTAAATGEVLRYDGSAWVDAVLNYSDLTGAPTLATVATSGSYNDLSNQPSIPANVGDLGDVTITAAATGEVLRYNGSAWVDAQLAYGDLTGTPVLEGIATNATFTNLDEASGSGTAGDVIHWTGSVWEQGQLDYSELTGTSAVVLNNQGATLTGNYTVDGNLDVTNGEIRVDTIDPNPDGVDGVTPGTLTILGNLQVDGTTTTINSTELVVDDLNITLASGAANAAAANGAGLTVDTANATFTYASSGDHWTMNKPLDLGAQELRSDYIKATGDGSADGKLDLQCSAGTHAVTLEGPTHDVSFTDYTLKMPDVAPQAGQILAAKSDYGTTNKLEFVEPGASTGKAIAMAIVFG